MSDEQPSDTKNRPTQLRLRAQSEEDVPVLSSLCQDAITKRVDLFYDRPARRFILLANRFCWEAQVKRRKWYQPRPRPTRVRSALRFDFVDKVQYSGPVQNDDDTPLNLLAIALQDGESVLQLSFSEGMKIAITAEVIDITLDDLSAPWSVKSRPNHKDTP